MTDDSPELRDVWVITTRDGTLLWCEPVWVGQGRAWYNHRWRIRSTTTEYTGPPVQPDCSAEAVRALIEEWWQEKKALGQVGVNAEILRARLNESGE